ncbi:outer-membrane lipoprotein carrier protein [Marinobacterium nitratireducens]|uniref:Outer-membrane lipoprotein carrier protein n=1 Tax=Marinobacterium nitratireducens TaxID=518897 RepID=A0A918DPG8_9GAMM|nr:outer membrane lipoprotein chaperone LolA [Marinobacterium nitratireducens]GGO76899.1 outer-membrane lipoprotein carrier protein [Marinobacterium nitratireducens]
MKQLVKALALGCACLLSTLSQATDAADGLQRLLQGYRTFSADFEQYSVSDGQRTEATRGTLELRKPSLFRWTSEEPFPQVIVNDGTYLWIYDPDLLQVTRKPFDRNNNSAPALILNGQIDRLDDDFDISLVHESDSEALYELLPKSEQSAFTRIRLFFQQQQVSELMLQDSLGQRTTIRFFNQRQNPELPMERFRFEVPEDVDLIIDPGV